MKPLIARLLGEDPSEAYNAHKYALEPPRLYGAPQPGRRVAPQQQPSAQELYGAPQPGRRVAPQQQPSAQEPVPFGCWIVPPENYEITGGRRQLVSDGVVPRVSREVAVTAPCPGPGTTNAQYEPETFLTPFDRAQDMVATGTLINTYTGEVASCFEDGLPPPDRTPGDTVRERKSAQLRLLAAEGNAPVGRHKKEQEDPLQAGDAGRILPHSMYRVSADVQQENAERSGRDLYFNRNELAPTEMMQTRNPFGFDGYNNRVRIQPYMPVTQELENKNWTPNPTLLPGVKNAARAATRLRADARPGAEGPRACYAEDEPLPPQVQVGNAGNALQSRSNFNVALELYGSAAAGEVALRSAREKQSQRAGGVEHGNGASFCASAESVLETLRGGSGLEVSWGGQDIGGQAHTGAQRARQHGDLSGASCPQPEMPTATGVMTAELHELPLESGLHERALAQVASDHASPMGAIAPLRSERATGSRPCASLAETAAALGGAVASSRPERTAGPQARAALSEAAAVMGEAGESRVERVGRTEGGAREGVALVAPRVPSAREVREEISAAPAEDRPDAPAAGPRVCGEEEFLKQERIWSGAGARISLGVCANAAEGARRQTARPEWLVPGSGGSVGGPAYGAAPPSAGSSACEKLFPTRARAEAESAGIVNCSAQRSSARGATGSRVRAGMPTPVWRGSGTQTTASTGKTDEARASVGRYEGSYAGNLAPIGAHSSRPEEQYAARTPETFVVEAAAAPCAVELNGEVAFEGVGAERRGEAACGAVVVGETSLRAPRALAKSGANVVVPAESALASCAQTELRALGASFESTWRNASLDIGRRKDPSSFFLGDSRGIQDVFRPVVAFIGGDVGEDPKHRFVVGVQEWKPEMIVAPIFDRSDLHLQERTRVGRLRTPQRREPLVARSPKATASVRSGIVHMLGDQLTSRCQEVVE